jgi:hypothetical protein
MEQNMNKKRRRALRLAKAVFIRNAYERGGCGGCRACCEALAVMELNKPYWRACQHQCETGCAIYHARPKSCRAFYCSYLMGDTPAGGEYRPDNLGLLLCLDTCHLTQDVIIGVALDCWEIRPGAFEANPWVKQLATDIAERRGCVTVFFWPYGQMPQNWDESGIKEALAESP